MSSPGSKNTRRARGLATYHAVYGEDAPLPDGGSAEFFERLILDHQFAEVWSRSALPIPARRLLTMGVLAAIGRFDILEFQFARTLTTGELTPEQVREVVIHLIGYVGTPSSGDLYRAGENAITAHREASNAAASPKLEAGRKKVAASSARTRPRSRSRSRSRTRRKTPATSP